MAVGKTQMDQAKSQSPWRYPNFVKLWSATTVSVFGDQFTRLALPLLAVETLHASAAQMGILTMAESLPILLFGLLAGVWVDRNRKKLILISADLARGLLLVTIPVATLIGMLHLAQLYVVAFLVGSLAIVFNVAYQSILPQLVQRTQLLDGNSKLEASRSVSVVAGPGFAGLIIQWLSAPLAIVCDGFSYVMSAILLARLDCNDDVREEQQRRRNVVAEVREGLALSLGDPYLRAIAGANAMENFFVTAIDALYILFLTRDLGLTAGMIGLIVSIGSIGSLGGAMLARPVAERLGIGTTILGATFLLAVSRVPIAVATPTLAIPLLIVARTLRGLVLPISNVNQLTLRQAITPDHLQGRMNATLRVLSWWTIPLGGLVGGILGSLIGVRLVISLAVLGGFATFFWLIRSPIRTLVQDHVELPEARR